MSAQVRAADDSPAAALAAGAFLSRVNGAAVGRVTAETYFACIVHVRAAPRPLTLEFVEGASSEE